MIGFFPGVMLLLSCWYKPNELSKRLALFYSASLMSGAFGGLLAVSSPSADHMLRADGCIVV